MRDTLGILLMLFGLSIGVWYAYRPKQMGMFFCKWLCPWVYWRNWALGQAAESAKRDYEAGRALGFLEHRQMMDRASHRQQNPPVMEYLSWSTAPGAGIPWRMWYAAGAVKEEKLQDHKIFVLWLEHMGSQGWTLRTMNSDFNWVILHRPRKVYMSTTGRMSMGKDFNLPSNVPSQDNNN